MAAASQGADLRGREGRDVRPAAVPEGFTAALAALDAVPVVLFCLSSIVLARRDVPFLARQMRYVMPLGFAMMVTGAVMRLDALAGVLASLVRAPAVVALAAWAACMVAMFYMAVHNRQDVARDNWVEEVVNTVGQAALLLALLL